MLELLILEEARQEWEEAALYYELQKKDLGEVFSKAVDNGIKLIQAAPEHFQKTKKEYREALVKHFPFLIVFRVDKTKNVIVVVSIFHTKRKPKLKYRK